MARSRVIRAADDALVAARAAVDPGIMELCEMRIRQLLRADPPPGTRVNPAKAAALAAYATSPLFDDRDRACIALAEHVCADTAGLEDEEIARVRRHLGEPGFVALAYALTLAEGRARVDVALGAS